MPVIDDDSAIMAVIEARGDEATDLPAYTGGETDLAYLHDYVLNAVVAFYGVDAAMFDTPSLAATTLLRDFVHRAIYNHPDLDKLQDLFEAGLVTNFRTDVGGLFRQEAWALCGEIATQLHNVFRAFGYDSRIVWTFNGEDGIGTPAAYNDGHVTVEVKIDGDRWIDQDSTFNHLLRDATGRVLDVSEARVLDVFAPDQLTIESGHVFLYYGTVGVLGIPPSHVQYYRDNYLGLEFGSQVSGFGTFNGRAPWFDWNNAHTAAQGGTFADAAAALAAVQASSGNLVERVDSIAAAHFATGFRLLGADDPVDFITVQLADLSCVTIRLDNGALYAGSYDQIVNAIFHHTSSLPDADQHLFLSHVIMIQADGLIYADQYIDPQSADYLALEAARVAAPAERDGPDGTRTVARMDDGSHDWSWVRESYDAQDRLVRTDTHYDDGSNGFVTYDVTHKAAIAWQETLTEIDGHVTQYRWEDANGVEHVQTMDYAEVQPWSYSTQVYSGAGVHLNDFVKYDDGSTLSTTFDSAGTNPWASYQNRAGADGVLLSQLYTYDDGGVLDVQFDRANAYLWSDNLRRYGPSGALTAQRYDYDAGGRLEIQFDAAKAYAWADIQLRYDASGALLAQRVDYDDGGYLSIQLDVANAYGWAQGQMRYNAAGALITQSYSYDTGGRLDTQFDAANAFVWSKSQSRYDGSGALVAQRYDYDDGGYLQIAYDVANGGTWSEVQSRYDSAGRLLQQLTKYDDHGSRTVEYDVAAFAAQTRITDRGADGAITIVRTTFAAGGADRIEAAVDYALRAGDSVGQLRALDPLGTAPLHLTGNERANTLDGNAGANLLNGGGGADQMAGHLGNDWYVVDNAGDKVFELANEGTDAIQTSVDYTLQPGASVEWLGTWGGTTTAPLHLTGNELANTLEGNAGANLLNGGGDADRMIGHLGNDWYVVDNVGDVVVEAAGEGTDAIQTSVDYALAAGSSIERLSTWGMATTTALRLTGNEIANTIVGNDGDNLLDGKGGADDLFGYGGSDTFAFTTALGAGNVDRVNDFQPGTDRIALDDAVFGGLPTGALAAGAFGAGATAQDADDRILYNPASGALYFDSDGIGGAAAIQFATLAPGLTLHAADFIVI